MRRANARRLKDNLRARARLSAAALIIYDTRNGIGRIRTYILYNNFQGLINVYYLPRNVMASRPPLLSVSLLLLCQLPLSPSRSLASSRGVIKNNTITLAVPAACPPTPPSSTLFFPRDERNFQQPDFRRANSLHFGFISFLYNYRKCMQAFSRPFCVCIFTL